MSETQKRKTELPPIRSGEWQRVRAKDARPIFDENRDPVRFFLAEWGS